MREIVLSMFGSKYKVFTLLPKELVFTREGNLSQKNKCKQWSRSNFFFSQKVSSSKNYKTFYIKTSQFEAKSTIRSVNQLQK